jgi:hypothetical protein
VGGWALWAGWQRVPVETRATLRRTYYGMAAVIAVVLLVGIVVMQMM